MSIYYFLCLKTYDRQILFFLFRLWLCLFLLFLARLGIIITVHDPYLLFQEISIYFQYLPMFMILDEFRPPLYSGEKKKNFKKSRIEYKATPPECQFVNTAKRIYVCILMLIYIYIYRSKYPSIKFFFFSINCRCNFEFEVAQDGNFFNQVLWLRIRYVPYGT